MSVIRDSNLVDWTTPTGPTHKPWCTIAFLSAFLTFYHFIYEADHQPPILSLLTGVLVPQVMGEEVESLYLGGTERDGL